MPSSVANAVSTSIMPSLEFAALSQVGFEGVKYVAKNYIEQGGGVYRFQPASLIFGATIYGSDMISGVLDKIIGKPDNDRYYRNMLIASLAGVASYQLIRQNMDVMRAVTTLPDLVRQPMAGAVAAGTGIAGVMVGSYLSQMMAGKSMA